MNSERITSSRTEFENFEQRRKYPRVILNDVAFLSLPGAQSLRLDLFDLSVCAIQARFDAHTEQTLRSVLHYVSDEALAVLPIRFTLKWHGQEEEIIVSCKPIYICQMQPDLFAMGMQFTNIERKYHALVCNFIEDCLEPL